MEEVDFEEYRHPWDCDEHWQIRKDFLECYASTFSLDRLLCLAQVYTNMELLGCSYPPEVMKQISLLAADLPKRSQKKNSKDVKFVAAKDDDSAAYKKKFIGKNSGDSCTPAAKRLKTEVTTYSKQDCVASSSCANNASIRAVGSCDSREHSEVAAASSNLNNIDTNGEDSLILVDKNVAIEALGEATVIAARNVTKSRKLFSKCGINDEHISAIATDIANLKQKLVRSNSNLVDPLIRAMSRSNLQFEWFIREAKLREKTIRMYICFLMVNDITLSKGLATSKKKARFQACLKFLLRLEALYHSTREFRNSLRQPDQLSPVRNPDGACPPEQLSPVRNPDSSRSPDQLLPVGNPDSFRPLNQLLPVRNPGSVRLPDQPLPVRNPDSFRPLNQLSPVRNPSSVCPPDQFLPVRNPDSARLLPQPLPVGNPDSFRPLNQLLPVRNPSSARLPDQFLPVRNPDSAHPPDQFFPVRNPDSARLPPQPLPVRNPYISSPPTGLQDFVVFRDPVDVSAYCVLAKSAEMNKKPLKLNYQRIGSAFKCDLLLNNILLGSETESTKLGVRNLVSVNVLNMLQATCCTIKVKAKFVYDSQISKGNLTNQHTNTRQSEAMQDQSLGFQALPADNVGRKLLEQMGWAGGGLGKLGDGIAEPITVKPIKGRSGLGHDNSNNSERQKHTFRANFKRFLQMYKRNGCPNDLMFTSEFTKEERKIMHEVALRLRLRNVSYGKGERRYLVISMKWTVKDLMKTLISNGGSNDKYQLYGPGQVENW